MQTNFKQRASLCCCSTTAHCCSAAVCCCSAAVQGPVPADAKPTDNPTKGKRPGPSVLKKAFKCTKPECLGDKDCLIQVPIKKFIHADEIATIPVAGEEWEHHERLQKAEAGVKGEPFGHCFPTQKELKECKFNIKQEEEEDHSHHQHCSDADWEDCCWILDCI